MKDMGKLMYHLLALVLLAATASFAQEYNGPPPEQSDYPYLLHAENLIPTEKTMARQEDRKKDTAYVVSGTSSPARTPLAEPIFIIQSDQIQPQDIQLYDMDVEKGNRETVFPKKPGKKTPRPRYLTFRQIEGGMYWIEVNEWLDNGQYCLTPRGANDVFCFEVY
jgi:hypothetical protein